MNLLILTRDIIFINSIREFFRDFIYRNKNCLCQTGEIYLSMICVHQEICPGIDKVTSKIFNNTNQTDRYIDSHTLHPKS